MLDQKRGILKLAVDVSVIKPTYIYTFYLYNATRGLSLLIQ